METVAESVLLVNAECGAVYAAPSPGENGQCLISIHSIFYESQSCIGLNNDFLAQIRVKSNASLLLHGNNYIIIMYVVYFYLK